MPTMLNLVGVELHQVMDGGVNITSHALMPPAASNPNLHMKRNASTGEDDRLWIGNREIQYAVFAPKPKPKATVGGISFQTNRCRSLLGQQGGESQNNSTLIFLDKSNIQ